MLFKIIDRILIGNCSIIKVDCLNILGAPDSLHWNKTGITLVKWSNIGFPVNVHIDANDILYIADENPNTVIWKLLPNSTIPTVFAGVRGVFGSSSSQLDYPQDIYIDRNQNAYVSDNTNCRIQKFFNGSTDGITIAGLNSTCGNALNQLYHMRFFAFDENETYVYIADPYNHRVMRFSTDSTAGSNGTLAAGGSYGTNNASLAQPYGVAMKSLLSNDIYITNARSHSIIRWTPGASNGVFVAGTPGTSGATPTTLNFPMGIQLDNYLNVYVADGKNERIQMFCAGSDRAFTIAGTGSPGSSATQLRQPRGIAFDSARNLYVADFENLRIQKFMKL